MVQIEILVVAPRRFASPVPRTLERVPNPGNSPFPDRKIKAEAGLNYCGCGTREGDIDLWASRLDCGDAGLERLRVTNLTMESREIDPRKVEEFIQDLTRDQRRILLYIYGLIPNWAEAEEVLQNTNLVLWRKLDGFQPGTNFFAWACSVAHFEVLKWRERRARDARTLSCEFIQEIGSELARQGDLIEQRHQALAGCLGKLKESDRRLILLRYGDGATTQSVAAQLGRPIKSIYAAVQRIRDGLLECINRTIAQDKA